MVHSNVGAELMRSSAIDKHHQGTKRSFKMSALATSLPQRHADKGIVLSVIGPTAVSGNALLPQKLQEKVQLSDILKCGGLPFW